jgi:hypothetical protein
MVREPSSIGYSATTRNADSLALLSTGMLASSRKHRRRSHWFRA